jgi:hypothetical protein
VGYTESDEIRPPGSTEFLIKGRDLGILDEDVLPDLCQKIRDRNDGDKPISEMSDEDLDVDIEDFLIELEESYDKIDWNSVAGRALGQSIFFIYELLRRYSVVGDMNDNYYRDLARIRRKTPYEVISLNYDTLFERALSFEGYGVNYYQQPKGRGDFINAINMLRTPPRTKAEWPDGFVNVAKIHGSINWMLNPRGHMPAQSDTIVDVSKVFLEYKFNNVIMGGSPPYRMFPHHRLRDTDYTDLVRTRTDWDHPMIIPPTGLHKKYEQFDYYTASKRMAREILQRTDELVIIGCSLRGYDDLLNDLLQEYLSPDVDVTVACRSSNADVIETMSEIVETQPDSYYSFSDYIEAQDL